MTNLYARKDGVSLEDLADFLKEFNNILSGINKSCPPLSPEKLENAKRKAAYSRDIMEKGLYHMYH